MTKYFTFIAALSVAVCGLSSWSTAEDEIVVQEKKDKYVIYEEPTIKKFSQLYWALGKLDADNDEDVDNFLRINECDIYFDYSQNEFEWRSIRDSGRRFILNNKKHFPIHFKFEQPLRLGAYNLETAEFEVVDKYKVLGVRRFEIIPRDLYEPVCGLEYKKDIPRYPRSLLAELNRPLTMDFLKVDPKIAEQFVAEKLDILKNEREKDNYTDEEIFEARDAYIILKIRAFSVKEDVKVKGTYARTLAKILAVLEGIEIYGDRDHQNLLYSEDFQRKKTRSAMELELKKKYKERLKKEMEARKKAGQSEAETDSAQ